MTTIVTKMKATAACYGLRVSLLMRWPLPAAEEGAERVSSQP